MFSLRIPASCHTEKDASRNGALLLYDVTSTYLDGRCCKLARHGYSRDYRRDRPQLVIGLLGAADGCPVAVESLPPLSRIGAKIGLA